MEGRYLMIASLLAYVSIMPSHYRVHHRFRETVRRIRERDSTGRQDHRFSIHQYQRDVLLLQWNPLEFLVSWPVC